MPPLPHLTAAKKWLGHARLQVMAQLLVTAVLVAMAVLVAVLGALARLPVTVALAVTVALEAMQLVRGRCSADLRLGMEYVTGQALPPCTSCLPLACVSADTCRVCVQAVVRWLVMAVLVAMVAPAATQPVSWQLLTVSSLIASSSVPCC
jgi:hypothetical protein